MKQKIVNEWAFTPIFLCESVKLCPLCIRCSSMLPVSYIFIPRSRSLVARCLAKFYLMCCRRPKHHLGMLNPTCQHKQLWNSLCTDNRCMATIITVQLYCGSFCPRHNISNCSLRLSAKEPTSCDTEWVSKCWALRSPWQVKPTCACVVFVSWSPAADSSSTLRSNS